MNTAQHAALKPAALPEEKAADVFGPPEKAGAESPGRWMIAIGLTLAVLMDALNGTIFTIARPHIMGDAGATPDEVSWVNLAYLMAKLACLPAAAWIVDRFGETRILLWSLTVVLLASLVAALTLDPIPFITARIAQGAAGAGLLIAAQTILFRLFPKARQGLVQALYALGVVMAPTTLAPAVQGWLIEDFSWTWVFWLNAGLAPAALLCLLPFRTMLPNTRRAGPAFDWIGFGCFSLSMTALVYVLLTGARWNWFDAPHIVLWTVIGLAALAIVVYRLVAGGDRTGFFDRSVFSNAHFSFGFFVSFFAGFALFGSAFLIPAFALNVLAMPPKAAGLLLLPSSLAVGIGLLFAGTLVTVKKLNPLKFVPFGVAFFMIALWVLSWSGLESGMHDMGGWLLLRGLSLGLLFLAVTLITLNDLAPRHIASGIGLFNFGRQMGGVLGISFLNACLEHQIALNRRVLIENINPASQQFQERKAALTEAFMARSFDPGLADQAAAAVIQKSIKAQVAVLSFNEGFFTLMLLFVVAVPLILAFKLMQKLTGWSH